ncbi:hypothetical protein MTP99_012526 [Tenebrio molitor]|nr:hypothetical protein MTP99_012526 [Tenebrio molitor]
MTRRDARYTARTVDVTGLTFYFGRIRHRNCPLTPLLFHPKLAVSCSRNGSYCYGPGNLSVCINSYVPGNYPRMFFASSFTAPNALLRKWKRNGSRCENVDLNLADNSTFLRNSLSQV